jgi:hypothetical protein
MSSVACIVAPLWTERSLTARRRAVVTLLAGSALGVLVLSTWDRSEAELLSKNECNMFVCWTVETVHRAFSSRAPKLTSAASARCGTYASPLPLCSRQSLRVDSLAHAMLIKTLSPGFQSRGFHRCMRAPQHLHPTTITVRAMVQDR